MKALDVVQLEREAVLEAQAGERVEQLALALASTKPRAERLATVAQRGDARDVADPGQLPMPIDQPRARDGEQERAKAGLTTKAVAVAHAGEHGLLHEVLGLVGRADLVVEEPVELVEVATKQLAARSSITLAPGCEQFGILAGSLAHRVTIRDRARVW